jgi:hypothetical protein
VIPTFWQWLLGAHERGGFNVRTIIDGWLFFHASLALVFLFFLQVSPYEFATKALFPAASILVGMAVAWTSRAATILQDKKFKAKMISKENPIESYVYGYQLSLLIIISCVVFVSIMASGGIKINYIKQNIANNISGFSMYFLLSMSIRECWQVINFSSMLSLLSDRIPNENEK